MRARRFERRHAVATCLQGVQQTFQAVTLRSCSHMRMCEQCTFAAHVHRTCLASAQRSAGMPSMSRTPFAELTIESLARRVLLLHRLDVGAAVRLLTQPRSVAADTSSDAGNKMAGLHAAGAAAGADDTAEAAALLPAHQIARDDEALLRAVAFRQLLHSLDAVFEAVQRETLDIQSVDIGMPRALHSLRACDGHDYATLRTSVDVDCTATLSNLLAVNEVAEMLTCCYDSSSLQSPRGTKCAACSLTLPDVVCNNEHAACEATCETTCVAALRRGGVTTPPHMPVASGCALSAPPKHAGCVNTRIKELFNTRFKFACVEDNETSVRALLEEGADVNCTAEAGRTPLHIVCSMGFHACAALLLCAGAKAEAVDALGRTPLHWACEGGHQTCASLLLGAGASARIVDHDGETPLHLACDQGFDACVFAFQEAGTSVDAVNCQGWTPLHTACSRGHVACVHALLDAGAAQEARDADGDTPLHIAVAADRSACVAILLDAGVSTRTANASRGQTPLHVACECGHHACVLALLDASADCHATDADGASPLQLARTGRYEECVRILERMLVFEAVITGDVALLRSLLEEGADPAAQNTEGKTPLHVACREGNVLCASVLLEVHADVEAVDWRGKTPLHVACRYGHHACVVALLQAGAAVEVVNAYRWTPLHWACTNAHHACVLALLNAGASTMVMDERQRTPLHLACKNGHVACVTALLDAGGSPHVVDESGRTPMHWACEKGYVTCAAALLGAGAQAEAVDQAGCSPIQIAHEMRDQQCMRLLINRHGVEHCKAATYTVPYFESQFIW